MNDLVKVKVELSSFAPTHPWYAIHTKSNYERITAELLARKGFECFLPLALKKRQWSDRAVESERPLFPGYLFCRFDPRQQLPILVTPGVVRVVGFGSQPIAVSDAEIVSIQALIASGFPVEAWSGFYEGQRVRINRGSLEGLEGTLVKKKNEYRFLVALAILHRSVSVEIDQDWLIKA